MSDLTPTPLHGDGEGSSAVVGLSGRGDVASPSLVTVLSLMQLGDSLFPSGAFAHSYGLEQLARERVIRTPVELQRYVESLLRQTLAPCDAVAAWRAFEAARAGDVAIVLDADRTLYRTKAPFELRAASVATGRRLVDEVSPHVEASFLQAYASALKADRSLGTQAVAFGVVCAALDVEDGESVVASLLLVSATAMLQASMRLMAISHRDVQATLHFLRPVIASLSLDVVSGGARPLQSFQPLQDIASMRHEAASARLFAS